MVSDMITEPMDCGLRKLTRDLPDRDQTIFGEIPILFACAENAAASPSPSGCGSGGGSAQPDIRLSPLPANVTQSTMLQLAGPGGGDGWPRSMMSSPGHHGPQNHGRERDAAFKQDESRVRPGRRDELPPGPRHAGILPASELLPGMEIKSRGVVNLFKAEPLLTGHCAALLMKDVSCDCKSRPLQLAELPWCDVGETSPLRFDDAWDRRALARRAPARRAASARTR